VVRWQPGGGHHDLDQALSTFAEEFEELGAEAMALHVAALCYCNRLLTDGRIPARKAGALFPLDDPDLAIKTLTDAGVWVETKTGYEIADFLTDQRPAETVLRERQLKSERQRRWRDKKSGRYAAEGVDASRNASGDGRPAPPRPERRGGVAAASGSLGGSPSPRPEVEHRPKANHYRGEVSGVAFEVQSFPLIPGEDVPPSADPSHTCIQFSVTDRRCDIDDPYNGPDKPVGQLLVALYQGVYDEAQQLAEAAPVEGSANLSGVEIVVPDDQAAYWFGLLVNQAIHTADVEALFVMLYGMVKERVV
jgi:hypothetical protein